MAGNTSNWSSNLPSGNSQIRHGDDDMRTHKQITEDSLNAEHYFVPVAGASVASGGIHRPGSGRVFSGTRASLATPSSADSADRLYYASDTESLHYIGQSSTTTIEWGRQRPGAEAMSAATSLPSAQTRAFIFANESYDVGGFYTAGASQFTVPSGLSGLYLLTGFCRFPSAHSGTRRAIAFAHGSSNTSITAMASCGTGNASGDFALSLSYVTYLADGVGVQMVGFQDSAGNLSVGTVAFTITRL